ncbi:ATP-binding protein [Rhizobium mongolense]|uniref:Putative ATPase/archaellum component FlaC n=1 Tax=Rhizobium mongolense TaxID=57676 RepID=A0A7W6RPQ3_9HYPH|nr:ATP-binding protein [Rhizobium mongolense]MBB4276385.1 putative ATPase/archaellum component FlaC [Rhizobium mongolense]
MWIESIRIEGGILDGFKQALTPKLNILIGGRGTGKSSVIELIRFCMGAASYTTGSQKEATEHALGVLGDGRVTLTIHDDGERFEISRTAQDIEADVAGVLAAPFIFAQSEIETIGLRAESRLRLIDGFVPHGARSDEDESTFSRIRSVTAEIRALLAEIDDISDRAAGLDRLKVQLDDVTRERATQSVVHQEINQLRQALEDLRPTISAAHVRYETVARAHERFRSWESALEDLLERRPRLEAWPSQAGGGDELADVRRREKTSIDWIARGLEEFRSITNELGNRVGIASSYRAGMENRARDIRQKMEERQQGASLLDKRVSDISQQISVLTSLADLRQERLSRVEELTRQRATLLAQVEKKRQQKTDSRQAVAARLNKDLGPAIRVSIKPYAQRRAYVSVLTAGLRGSGLRYNELAERAADTFSPAELALLVERRELTTISKSLEIGAERAIRFCDALRGDAGGELFTTVVEDDVQIELLDGSDYKTTDFLSMGQRCTTILPIILRHRERVIILDQPEDHLDNAFIVGTLVRSIAARSNSAQTIVATHNPNIPVIGDASKVIHLDSDGNRCFVKAEGALTSPNIVEAITTIMEGGREAFARRAEFYGESLPNVFS